MRDSGHTEGDDARRAAAGGWEVTTVARRLGVAPATVRSWQRRYGIGPSAHTPGRRRVYDPVDVARLQLMHAALVRGMTAAEAARWALCQADPEGALGEDRYPEPDADPGEPARPPRPGGRGPRPEGRDPGTHGLERAVLALDPDGIRAVVADAVADRGVVRTWDELARPVLTSVGERWARSGAGVEREHLLSECLVREFDRAASAGRRAPADDSRPVLLACVPDEAHSLPLSPLAAALAQNRVHVHLFGAALPPQALDDAVRRLAPAAVLLWAHAPPRRPVRPAAGPSRRCRWFVGGPGWTTRTPPPDAVAVGSLAEAVDALSRAALGGLTGNR